MQVSNNGIIDIRTPTDLVTISALSISGEPLEAVAVEWKVWFQIPTIEPIGWLNFGSDGSIVLEAGFFADLAPFDLFLANEVPLATYTIGCRVLNPVTGELFNEDFTSFEILP